MTFLSLMAYAMFKGLFPGKIIGRHDVKNRLLAQAVEESASAQ